LLQKSFSDLIYVKEHAKNCIGRTYPLPRTAGNLGTSAGYETTGAFGPARYQAQESAGKMREPEVAEGR